MGKILRKKTALGPPPIGGFVRLPTSPRRMSAGRVHWHMRRNERCTMCGQAIPDAGVLHRAELEERHKPCRACQRSQARFERSRAHHEAEEQYRAERPSRQEYLRLRNEKRRAEVLAAREHHREAINRELEEAARRANEKMQARLRALREREA